MGQVKKWPSDAHANKEAKDEAIKPTAKEDDMVNHPRHYTQYSHEVIELTERCDFCLGNALKYILRAPFKGRRAEDLDKSMWYLRRYFAGKNSIFPDAYKDSLSELALPYVMDLIKRKEYGLCAYLLGVIYAQMARDGERTRTINMLAELAEKAKEEVK